MRRRDETNNEATSRGPTAESARRKSRAQAYYDGVAEEYAEASSEGWFHRVRRREVAVLVRCVAPAPGVEVLDVGCGPGEIARLLTERGARVTGIDVSPRMLVRARPHLAESLERDIDSLDLGRTFDAVLCSGVLEFAADAGVALLRMADHVRPGGRLVLLFPTRGVGGFVYAWIQRRRGLGVALQSPATIMRALGHLGFTLTHSARPFFHCRVLAFQRR